MAISFFEGFLGERDLRALLIADVVLVPADNGLFEEGVIGVLVPDLAGAILR